MSEKQPKKSVVEKFLNIFTEVHAGEGVSAIALTLNIFLLMTAYYIIKPVREALILAGGGAEVKSYSSAGQALLLLLAVPLYSMLASRFPRRKLITTVTIFFSACLALFYILARFNLPLGIVFYLWVGIFNLMVVAQFWAFANDLYLPDDGKRLFVIVAFGQSSGAVFGAFITRQLIGPLGIYQLLLLSGLLLLLSLLVTGFIDSRAKPVKKDTSLPQPEEQRMSSEGAFHLVFRNRYLLLIALLMLLLNWVNTNGEYILSRTVANAADTAIAEGTAGGLTKGEFIGKFYADFFGIVNILGFVIQLLLVSRILKYFGIRIALCILPVIALGGYVIISFIPLLSIVRWAKSAENSCDYSLQNTIRQILFLPTTREQKYKAKQAIDTFFVRSGDVLSGLLVLVGTTVFSFTTKIFALFNLGLVLIWIVFALLIGRENVRLTKESSDQQQAG
jgi:AAA family ATP:ADP antiporter